MRFRLTAVGRMDRPLADVATEYVNRIIRYVNFDLIVVPEGRAGRSAGEKKKKEAAGLLKAVGKVGHLVTVTRSGSAYSSRDLAGKVDRWQFEARDVTFAIGGSEGFDQTVLERGNETLSLSKMTLPHDLTRLLFLEQFYRACTILRGEPYHRGP